MIFCAERHGFTLIQMLVVFSLVALLMTLSLPHTAWMRRYVMRAELEKMYTLFFYMQHRAIASNQQQSVIFDAAGGAYSTEHIQERLPLGITFGFLPHTKGPPATPKKPIEKAITFVDNKVLFYPDGTFSAGTVYLVDRERNALYALTSAVAPVSYVRKYRYEYGSWVPVP